MPTYMLELLYSPETFHVNYMFYQRIYFHRRNMEFIAVRLTGSIDL